MLEMILHNWIRYFTRHVQLVNLESSTQRHYWQNFRVLNSEIQDLLESLINNIKVDFQILSTSELTVDAEHAAKESDSVALHLVVVTAGKHGYEFALRNFLNTVLVKLRVVQPFEHADCIRLLSILF